MSVRSNAGLIDRRVAGTIQHVALTGAAWNRANVATNTQPSAGTIRFVDFCAGLGGFHRALSQAVSRQSVAGGGGNWRFCCVAASELENDLRRCYVRNFPALDVDSDGFGSAATDQALLTADAGATPGLARALPIRAADGTLAGIYGDMACFLTPDKSQLRRYSDGRPVLPAHDLLCAGFPCQPFSKSGSQRGFEDTRGTVFHMIATMLRESKPAFLLLENVGNFGRHDGGHTWERVKAILEVELGYDVVATEHVQDDPTRSGLLSPHHLGYPHHRERFFMVAQRREALPADPPEIAQILVRRLGVQSPFPTTRRGFGNSGQVEGQLAAQAASQLRAILQSPKSPEDLADLELSQVSPDRVVAIDHWNRLLRELDRADQASGRAEWRRTMPSFPIWGYELDPWNWYPARSNPAELGQSPELLREAKQAEFAAFEDRLGRVLPKSFPLSRFAPRGARSWLAGPLDDDALVRWRRSWPAYAGGRDAWPRWKQRFIEQNREWATLLWERLDPDFLRDWLDELYERVPAASNQKLEWNCKGERLDLWEYILQFRPSGVRAKRMTQVPALVAMTTTQIPIVPRLDADEPPMGSPSARGRHLIPSEALQLQGFPRTWVLPELRERVFASLGNAVHAGLVADIVGYWLFGATPSAFRALSSLPVIPHFGQGQAPLI